MMIYTKYSWLLFCVVFSGCLNKGGSEPVTEISLNKDTEQGSVIEFENDVSDLGVIREGEQVAAWFTYKNSGNAPLILQDIKAGCGCTVPRWNDKPLEAGNSETIRIIFNSTGKSGAQNIRISVYSNARNPVEDLFLKANVESIN